MNKRTGVLLRASGAVAVLLAIAAGCSTPAPSVAAPSSASTSGFARTPIEQPVIGIPEHGCRAEGRVRRERAGLGRGGRLGITDPRHADL